MKRSESKILSSRFRKEVSSGKKIVSKNIASKDPLTRKACIGIDNLSKKILRVHKMGATNSQLRFHQKNLEEILFTIGSNASKPETKGKLVVSKDLLESISSSNRLAQKELSDLFEKKLRRKIREKPKKRRPGK